MHTFYSVLLYLAGAGVIISGYYILQHARTRNLPSNTSYPASLYLLGCFGIVALLNLAREIPVPSNQSITGVILLIAIILVQAWEYQKLWKLYTSRNG
jgi:hypothetical protein